MLELTPLFLYESFILVIGVAAVFAFAFFYFRLLRGYHMLRQKYLEIEKNTKQEVDQLMKQSHQQAIATIQHSQVLSDELKKQLTKVLQESAKKDSSAYHQMMESVGEELKEESEEMIRQFSQEMKQDITEAENDLQSQLQAKYQQVDQEIIQYKQQRMSEIDQKIGDIIQQVLFDVSGRTISLDQQHELLQDAIQQAKHEHIL